MDDATLYKIYFRFDTKPNSISIIIYRPELSIPLFCIEPTPKLVHYRYHLSPTVLALAYTGIVHSTRKTVHSPICCRSRSACTTYIYISSYFDESVLELILTERPKRSSKFTNYNNKIGV